MVWKVEMEMVDHIRQWSNQQIETEYSDVDIVIEIQDGRCKLILEGESLNINKVFYLVWEVLFMYDGYFYKPLKWSVDGEEKEANNLIRTGFYQSGYTWISFSFLLGRAERDLSEKILKNFDKMRNEGKENLKMTKSVVNAFFYLHSEGYEKINESHRLSL